MTTKNLDSWHRGYVAAWDMYEKESSGVVMAMIQAWWPAQVGRDGCRKGTDYAAGHVDGLTDIIMARPDRPLLDWHPWHEA
jgi:hypothetical protein